MIKAGAVVLGAVRCALSMALALKENLLFVLRRGTQEPFDGIAEIWFENAPAALAALQRPDWREGLARF